VGVRRIGVALLAAGSSQRFGESDKLSAAFRGRMVAEHAALAIPTEVLGGAWVVTAGPDHPCEPIWRARGFTPLINPRAGQGMGTSVALAAKAAIEASLDALMIALADMPLVPRSHFAALISAASGVDEIAVSTEGNARMPPAIFGRGHFEALARSYGDKGARTLLQKGEVIACSPAWLKDIDTIEDL